MYHLYSILPHWHPSAIWNRTLIKCCSLECRLSLGASLLCCVPLQHQLEMTKLLNDQVRMDNNMFWVIWSGFNIHGHVTTVSISNIEFSINKRHAVYCQTLCWDQSLSLSEGLSHLLSQKYIILKTFTQIQYSGKHTLLLTTTNVIHFIKDK